MIAQKFQTPRLPQRRRLNGLPIMTLWLYAAHFILPVKYAEFFIIFSILRIQFNKFFTVYPLSFEIRDFLFAELRKVKKWLSESSTPVRVTIALSGEIDHHNAAALRLEADEAIQSAAAPNVRLDFADVSFMDSSGIGFVLGRYRIVESYGGNIEVVNLSDRLFSMMKLAGLEKLVTLKAKH